MTRPRLTPEQQKARLEAISKRMVATWADPEKRAAMSAAQSAGSLAAWSDPEKAAERLRKREERAKELGFESYGKLAQFTRLVRIAEKCKVDYEVYINMSSGERRALREKLGISKKRRRK